MTTVRLKYVDQFVDKTGRARFYFRRPKGKRISLPGLPGSAPFMEAYNAALGGSVPASPPKRAPVAPADLDASRTIDKLLDAYYAAPEFLTLAPSTQDVYRRVYTRWVVEEKIGHRPVAGLNREIVGKMIGRRKETPGAANDLLKKIRLLMAFAIRIEWRTSDPTLKMRKFKGGEWHTWTEEQIAAYEARWPSGTKARLALALHLYTGQRVSDVATMMWSDVADRKISVVQQKTGAKLWIPLHPALATELASVPRTGPALMMTAHGKGKPFTPKGLSNWMADRIEEAGLPEECITHGLRKAAARRLAEAGCSAKQIASITGHKTLSEVERYVRDAEQKIMAVAAIEAISDGQKFQTPKSAPAGGGKNADETGDWRARKSFLPVDPPAEFFPNPPGMLRRFP